MPFITDPHTVWNTVAAAEKIAAACNAAAAQDGADAWSSRVVPDPNGGPRAIIAIDDESGHFLGYLQEGCAMANLYATDGKCHNAEPGTYGHECGRPAMWIGTDRNGFRSGFCLRCRAEGFEARAIVKWEPAPAVEPTSQGQQIVIPGAERSAQQLALAREHAGHGRIRAGAPQRDPGGLFAPLAATQPKLL